MRDHVAAHVMILQVPISPLEGTHLVHGYKVANNPVAIPEPFRLPYMLSLRACCRIELYDDPTVRCNYSALRKI